MIDIVSMAFAQASTTVQSSSVPTQVPLEHVVKAIQVLLGILTTIGVAVVGWVINKSEKTSNEHRREDIEYREEFKREIKTMIENQRLCQLSLVKDYVSRSDYDKFHDGQHFLNKEMSERVAVLETKVDSIKNSIE